ncbi:MAG: hypothetical protein V9H69_19670 [Anaerolineae bacterium]
MKQYETRSEYMDAIARALGLGDRDDLSYPHRDMLQRGEPQPAGPHPGHDRDRGRPARAAGLPRTTPRP